MYISQRVLMSFGTSDLLLEYNLRVKLHLSSLNNFDLTGPLYVALIFADVLQASTYFVIIVWIRVFFVQLYWIFLFCQLKSVLTYLSCLNYDVCRFAWFGVRLLSSDEFTHF